MDTGRQSPVASFRCCIWRLPGRWAAAGPANSPLPSTMGQVDGTRHAGAFFMGFSRQLRSLNGPGYLWLQAATRGPPVLGQSSI